MTTITDNTVTLMGVPTTSKPVGSMDQNDFLRLMTKQLTTQDPFNPMDNTQMVAQLAQFSQVAGLAEMNASRKSLVENMSSRGRRTDPASWNGRSCLLPPAKGRDTRRASVCRYVWARGVAVTVKTKKN